MSSVNFFCERAVRPDGTIWLKKKIYYDPKGKLMQYVGRTLKVENPHHPKYVSQDKLYVYDLGDYLITSVVVVKDERPPPKNKKKYIPRDVRRLRASSELPSSGAAMQSEEVPLHKELP